MSIDALKQELTALTPEEQRHITAFLVALQDARDHSYRAKLADKIDKPASQFARLEQLDERLNLSDDDPQRP